MKVQWQLVDIETKKPVVSVGKKFDILDCSDIYKTGQLITWAEAKLMFGNPMSDIIPKGLIRGLSPIDMVRKSVRNNK